MNEVLMKMKTKRIFVTESETIEISSTNNEGLENLTRTAYTEANRG